MSILPEMIIQQTLIRGIRAFREDERLLGMLFRNVDAKELSLIREWLRNDSIEVCINYPDQDVKIPFIVILLKNESESQPFLGDLQQSVDDLETLGGVFIQDELTGDQTIIGSGSASTVGFTAHQWLRPTRAIDGAASIIVAPHDVTALIDPYEEIAYVVVMEGAAAGDRREIASIVPDIHGTGVVITVTTPFSAVPDATSVFKIIGAPDPDVTGEPAQLYKVADRIERRGTTLRAVYQMDIAASPQEMVIYLYNIVKAIFFVSSSLLIKQGFLTNIKLSGTDLAPVTEYYPTAAFRRSLSIEFEYSFDVFTDVSDTLATSIEVALGVHYPDVTDVNGIEVEVNPVTP